MSRAFRVFAQLCLGLGAGLALAQSAWSQAVPPPGVGATPAALAPARSPEDEARRKQVIAKVEGSEITVGQVEDFLNTQPPMMRERYRSSDEQQTLIDNMVRRELLAAEAARRGYDKNPVVVRTIKDSAVQALLRADIDSKYLPQNLPADEVKAYYEANPAEFHRPAMRRASQIVLATEAEAKELLPEAQKADVRGFAELAKQRSVDGETKLRGGDLGYFPKDPAPGSQGDSVKPAVREAIFALKENGDTAGKPVAVDTGFAIVRLTGERAERNTDLAEADNTIRTKLWREKRQKAMTDLVESLRAREKPQVFGERADWVKFDDMDKRPPGFAPDRPPGKPSAGKPGNGPTEPGTSPTGAHP